LTVTVADALRRLAARGWKVLLIPMTFGRRSRTDRDALDRLHAASGAPEQIVHAPEGLLPQQLKYLFAHAGGAVVTRHHAFVFAIASGVPCVAIVMDEYYRQKLGGMASESDGKGILVPLDRATSDALVEQWPEYPGAT
jgi:polysaccharide pyruvyl transferase WcaK-like protein